MNKSDLEKLLGEKIKRYHLISDGGNSLVHEVLLENREHLAVKQYIGSPKYSAMYRLTKEYQACKLLHQNNIHCVPTPIAVYEADQCASYQWSYGEKITSIGMTDIDQVVDFIGSLKQLSALSHASIISPASDANLSIQSLVDNIEHRLKNHLDQLQDSDAIKFIQEKLQPTFVKLVKSLKLNLNRNRLCSQTQLIQKQLILSPSDFSLHNALRLINDSIIFLDFEHFGWDDPIAMLCSFFWHPAMPLSEKLKRYFIATSMELFDSPACRYRLKLLLPLYGVMWCCILFNELIPNIWQKRVHVGQYNQDYFATLKNEQLLKAQDYLAKICSIGKEFPYA